MGWRIQEVSRKIEELLGDKMGGISFRYGGLEVTVEVQGPMISEEEKAKVASFFPPHVLVLVAASRGRAVEAHQAHNLEVEGSNPSPATRLK